MTVMGTDESAPVERGYLAIPPWTSLARRLLDIAVGVPLCLLLLIPVLVLSLVLMVRFRANPIFVHKRIGRDGKLMSIPKLRTLPPATNPYADKTVVDLRAPNPFTAFLRTRHLDELPQLYLVPIGRLSLVGPRPRMPFEAEALGDETYNTLRTSIRQGCTGLWQVGEDTGRRVSDHPEYDLVYLSQVTVRLDLWILWRTLCQALGGRGFNLGEVPRWLWRDPDALPISSRSTVLSTIDLTTSRDESLAIAPGV